MSESSIILIVDDQPENISVLHGFLSESGYDLRVAADGPAALKIVEREIPDIILLDIMMPGMDGFEVCRILKKSARTEDVPVIFMTALTALDSKLEGFAAGAVDYITKPFNKYEILARVDTHLRLFHLNRELEERNRQMRERNEELDAFAHTVAHDLKNPLNVVATYSSLLVEQTRVPDEEARATMLAAIKRNAYQATDIIDALLLLAGISRRAQPTLAYFPMEMAIDRALSRVDQLVEEQQAVIRKPDSWPAVNGYAPWVEEVWFNYISNAIKYGGEPPEVELGADEGTDGVRFWVKDNGPGLSAEEQAKLFTPFTRLSKERATGHGLGLSIVERVVKRLGGSTGVESEPGQGARFFFTVPRPHAADSAMKADEYSD